jgi:hypothetical protein
MRSGVLLGATLALALTAASAPARAEEPIGCDKFKWPVTREQAALAAADKNSIAQGSVVAAGTAALVHLAPVDQAHFPLEPQRAPAAGSYAAVLKFTVPTAGVYTVSLSAGAWIDVIQEGAMLKPLAFSGARECPHIHKSLKFQLAPQEAILQISNAAEQEISVVVMPQ